MNPSNLNSKTLENGLEALIGVGQVDKVKEMMRISLMNFKYGASVSAAVGNLDLLRYFFDEAEGRMSGRRVKRMVHDCLVYASNSNAKIEIFRYLLDKRLITPTPQMFVQPCRSGREDIVFTLMDEEGSKFHTFALLDACQGSNERIVRRMMKDERVHKGPEILGSYFRYSCNKEMFEILLECDGLDPGDAIIWAATFWDTEFLSLILQSPRLDLERHALNILTTIITHAGSNAYPLMKAVLENGRIDPSIDNNVAISLAARFCCEQTVGILLKDSRVDPSANDRLGT